jgi:hypothetical protein
VIGRALPVGDGFREVELRDRVDGISGLLTNTRQKSRAETLEVFFSPFI